MLRFVAGLIVLCVAYHLTGCDAQELERIRAEAESNARIAQACTPQVGQRVIAEWVMQNEQQALSLPSLSTSARRKGRSST